MDGVTGADLARKLKERMQQNAATTGAGRKRVGHSLEGTHFVPSAIGMAALSLLSASIISYRIVATLNCSGTSTTGSRYVSDAIAKRRYASV